MFVSEWNGRIFFSLLPCESTMSEKENPDRESINYYKVFTLASFMFKVIVL